MIEIQINESDINRLERLFVNVETKIKKPINILKQIGQYMLGSIDKNFETQGRPNKWAHLASSTIKNRRNKNKSTIKILQDTGMLRKSITYDATDDQVAIGTNLKYARIHQYGGDIKQPFRHQITNFRKYKSGKVRFSSEKKATFSQKNAVLKHFIKIPARPFLMFQDEDKDAIREIFVTNLKNQQ